MPEDTAPPTTDSNDPDVIEAQAKLLEAQAKLTKANVPLFDKIVLRGVIPIALALVGPWALWKFDKATTEQERQGQVITQLQDLLESAKKEEAARQEQSAKWRERMKALEDKRSEELGTMSSMVSQLDETMKTALIHMTVARLVAEREIRGAITRSPAVLSRKEVMSDAAAQIQLPGSDPSNVEEMAGQAFDRLMGQRQGK